MKCNIPSNMFPDLPFDYEQCFEEDERLKKSDIEELRTWIQGLPSNSYIPKNISDKMLVIVHCACDFKVEHTKKCLSVCYEIRFKDPKLFNGRDVDTEEMQLAFRTLEFCLIPDRTDDGYDVVLHRLKDYNPQNYFRDTAARSLLMTLDRISYERGPSKGVILVFDFTGGSYGHIFRSTITQVRSYMRYIQDGLPIKVKSLHVLNTTGLFQRIMSLVKPLMHSELIKNIATYPVNYDMEKFYDTVLARKNVPKDFGGLLPSIAELHEENWEALRKMKPFFTQEEENRKLCWNNNNN